MPSPSLINKATGKCLDLFHRLIPAGGVTFRQPVEHIGGYIPRQVVVFAHMHGFLPLAIRKQGDHVVASHLLHQRTHQRGLEGIVLVELQPPSLHRFLAPGEVAPVRFAGHGHVTFHGLAQAFQVEVRQPETDAAEPERIPPRIVHHLPEGRTGMQLVDAHAQAVRTQHAAQGTLQDGLHLVYARKGQRTLLDDDTLDAGTVVYHHDTGGKLVVRLFCEIFLLDHMRPTVRDPHYRHPAGIRNQVAVQMTFLAPRTPEHDFPRAVAIGGQNFGKDFLPADKIFVGMDGGSGRSEKLSLHGRKHNSGELVIIIAECTHVVCSSVWFKVKRITHAVVRERHGTPVCVCVN